MTNIRPMALTYAQAQSIPSECREAFNVTVAYLASVMEGDFDLAALRHEVAMAMARLCEVEMHGEHATCAAYEEVDVDRAVEEGEWELAEGTPAEAEQP
jgi:hypothetical protein